jgi:hypothetical protein
VVTIFDAPFSERRLCADGDHAPLTVAADLSSIVNTSAAMTLPATTWHVRIAVSLGMSANKVSTCWLAVKCFVGRRKHCKCLRLERWDQTSRSNSSSQSLERSCRNRGVNNVMHGEIRGSISTIVERM